MQSTDLKPEQIKKLKQQIGRQLRYFARLRDRMTRVGFRGDDKLFLAACRVYNGVHAVNVELHYLGCEHGVGRAPRDG